MEISRRRFIRQAACAALGTTSIASTVWNLRAINAATAQAVSAGTTGPEFRALVCLFLYGGNDANNMVVPTDNTTYNVYSIARGPLALAQSSLLPLNLVTPDPQGRTFGLHPNMPELQSLFNTDRKLAVMANVGTLVEPTTAAQYLNGTAKVPPQLFSHADQQVEWQTGWADGPAITGWGGRLADLLTSWKRGERVSCFHSGSDRPYRFRRNKWSDSISSSPGSVEPAAPESFRIGVRQNHQPRRHQQQYFVERGFGNHLEHAVSGQLGPERSIANDRQNHRSAGRTRNAAPNLLLLGRWFRYARRRALDPEQSSGRIESMHERVLSIDQRAGDF
ncbi:MAG: hypothetical protein DME57_04110 [Verrucomicrobia bacterium]|nr:MAG: hypothetical protein DME57_04110 [Verrucomicrobiota bacterium]